jgi:site-specific recombinase XerD
MAGSKSLTVGASAPPARLQDASDLAAFFARADKALSTRKAYRSDLGLFHAWCTKRRVPALPATPETVAAFVATEAMRSRLPTIRRRLAAIRYVHRIAGLPVPTDDERVKAVVRGVRRTIGAAVAKKAPATNDKVLAMVAAQDGSLTNLRDRALLLLGFAGALRRSELVALDVEDITETAQGLKVIIRHSKTDQEGAGSAIAIVRGSLACPVAALRAWLAAATIANGPVFRRVNKAGRVLPSRLTAQSVALIVKARAKRIGLNPEQFSGHSLRAGFLTSAARHGASLFKMMDVSRHRNLDTLKGYVRDSEMFTNHAGNGLL